MFAARCCRQLILRPASRCITLSATRLTVLKKPPKWASNYVRRLNPFEQLELMAALRIEVERSRVAPLGDNFPQEATAAADGSSAAQPPSTGTARVEVAEPTRDQLRQVALLSAIPFIGFGFFDNAIMIVAGEYIDMTLGTWLGLTTLAAAAIGNWISDIAGLSLAGYVEAVASRFGFENPQMTPQQMELRVTRWFTVLGRCVGITIGCFLGMLPLMFFGDSEDEGDSKGAAAADKPATK